MGLVFVMKDNLRLLVLFIGLFAYGSVLVFGLEAQEEEDEGDLVEQIKVLNEEIQGLSSDETEAYLSAIKDSSCKDNATVLHNQFMDILAQYKPFQVTWENYDPVKNFKVDPENEDEQESLLEAMEKTAGELEGLLAQIKDNLKNCTPVQYNFKTYKHITYPVYTYSYPEYSSYYRPLLYGAGAWGLWSGVNAFHGWGGYHRWRGWHRGWWHRHGWNRHHGWRRHHGWHGHHGRRGGHHGGRHGGHRGGHHGGHHR